MIAATISWADGEREWLAFEQGFVFAMALRGQNLEDSRAVGRNLYANDFEDIRPEIDEALRELGFDSFKDAESGIVQCKAIIRRAYQLRAIARSTQQGG
jgi:hypothetical protein